MTGCGGISAAVPFSVKIVIGLSFSTEMMYTIENEWGGEHIGSV